MRKKEGMDRIIEKLKQVWKANPEFSLCQLVVHIVHSSKRIVGQNLFDVQDGVFETTLNDLIDKLEENKKAK